VLILALAASTNTDHRSRTDDAAPDGQQLSVASRELGNTEVYAQTLQHSPNGR
jgi:coatomer subunit beta'